MRDAVKELAKKAIADMGGNALVVGSPKKSRASKTPENPVFRVEMNGSVQPVYLPVADLQIDERYQFHPEKEAGRITMLNSYLFKHGGFNQAMAGAIHVSKRKGGGYFVVDGYGRVWMGTRMVKNPITHIPCIVHTDLTWEEEAILFIELNRHKRTIKTPHLFVVAANSGHEPEASILQAVLASGYAVERMAHKKGAIFASTALVFAHKMGMDVLINTLHVMRLAWGDQKKLDGRHLVAVSAVIAANKNIISYDRLLDVLSHKDFTPEAAASAARQRGALAVTTRNPQSRDTNPYLARIIIKRYNHGLDRGSTGRKAIKRLDAEALDKLQSHFDAEEQYKDVWDFRA